MDYIRLYITLRDDPKMIGLSDKAFRAYIETMLWCGLHETNGDIPDGLIPDAVAKQLVKADLWHPCEGGYFIPWKRQKSKEELEATRIARAKAGAKGGASTWHSKRSSKPSSKPAALAQSKSIPEVEVEKELEKTQLQNQVQHLAPRRRDELFETVAEVCGINTQTLTKSGRGNLNGAVGQLRPLDPTPDDVRSRAANWPYDVPLTPPGLAKHWATLEFAKPRLKRSTTAALSRAARLEAEGR